MSFLKSIGKVFKKVAPIVGGVLGGPIGALGGSVLEGVFSAKSAKKQMRFQERMSSTAHQREISDLSAAGLNPILSATGGGGASSPSGAGFDVPNIGEAVVNAQMMKLQRKLMAEQIRSVAAEADNKDADTRNKNYDWQLKREYAPLEKQASLWETKTRIKNLIQSTSHSAVETATKRSRLQRELKDPELQQWIISEGYASQKQLDRLLSGDGDMSDMARIGGLIIKYMRGK